MSDYIIIDEDEAWCQCPGCDACRHDLWTDRCDRFTLLEQSFCPECQPR